VVLDGIYMDWKMVGLIIWLQVLYSVNGLKLELTFKLMDDTPGLEKTPRSDRVTNPELSENSPSETDQPDQHNSIGSSSRLYQEDRIVGGVEVKPHSLPWQVAFMYTGNNMCGGTILCRRFVMTAGHCVINEDGSMRDPKGGRILVGRHDLHKSEPSAAEHATKTFHLHPSFKPINANQANDDNDFAIVELKDPIVFKKEAKALFLPKPSDTEFGDDTKFLVSGWGKMEDIYTGRISDVLNMVTLPWVSDSDCKEAYKDKKTDNDGRKLQYLVSDSNICAGSLGVGKIDACSGDSGGALAWMDPITDEVKLIGTVSYGHECAKADSPGVFAETTFALDWIEEIIGNCNEETCDEGMCMTKDSLDRSVLQSFNRVTPHKRFQ